MGWAKYHIAKLISGQTVTFRPHGGSMRGRIEPGQFCTLEPVGDPAALVVGDIVLCRIGEIEYLHLIKAIDRNRFQIGNNLGKINGWTSGQNIFGKCINIES